MWSPWSSGLCEIHGILKNKAGRVSTASACRAGGASRVQRSTLPGFPVVFIVIGC